MGIIDFGLFFTDRLAVKQGIREGARDAVVSDRNVCPGASLDCLADQIEAEIGAVGGATYVQVDVEPVLPLGPGWLEGNELRVCVIVTEDGLTGITPMPDKIADELRMRIENDRPTSGTHGDTGTSPPGGWGWC